MAAGFAATNYGTASTFDPINGGWQVNAVYNGPVYNSFGSETVNIIGVSPALTVQLKGGGTATINSIIEVIPSGLTLPSFTKKYLCDSTSAQLNTLRNA